MWRTNGNANNHQHDSESLVIRVPNEPKKKPLIVPKIPIDLTDLTDRGESNSVRNSARSSLVISTPQTPYTMPTGDGSWDLRILVTDLQVERTIRVNGNLHIGGVMIKVVDELDIAMDWSDHAIWWPEKNLWLDKTRLTLDQYNLTADAIIHFTPMHKMVRIQLPDLRYIDCNVDFSIRTFNAVIDICTELADTNTFVPNSGTLGRKISSNSWTNSPARFRSLGRNGTLDAHRRRSEHNAPLINGTLRGNGSLSPYSNGNGHLSTTSLAPGFPGSGSEWSLAMSPPPSEEAKYSIVRPKNLAERARLNVGWLDSSLSLMEQGIRDFDTLLLRFKFYSFYNLNTKTDPVRINLIYEQAKWQILNEGIDCTEEEMMLFASLQLQVGLQANVPQPNEDEENEDDIDAALTDLQISLEGGSINSNGVDIMTVPSLNDTLRYLRPKRFTLKGYKRCHFQLRDLQLSAFKSKEDSMDYTQGPSFTVNLKGCEISPEVNIAQGRYGIRLSIPSQDGMSDLWLKCDSEGQYSRWMAACRLAAKGRTMADSTYDSEVKAIQAFLSMQHPANAPVINPSTLDINVEEYVAPRFLRKQKSRLRNKILEAHTNVKELNLVEAKMNFIKAWQSLPDYGVSLFVARFHGEKKNELLGVACNRLMRMNLHTGDHIKTWRYNTIKAWNVNWETKHMMIQLGDGKNMIFKSLSADCKVVHEFIGGYIFLSMRNKDANQQLDEELFHKLTGGWY
ncbi:hypothetical protein TCAL_00238 [Tigriopus californicus]|uniref:PH domain-containing protein n=1 Tax=Tigriopus californicus TaxID=6832 RepID=A0A553P3H9_TIGCA|nr:hypothetical protein TCAL_00238 [Tigriopus californicus]